MIIKPSQLIEFAEKQAKQSLFWLADIGCEWEPAKNGTVLLVCQQIWSSGSVWISTRISIFSPVGKISQIKAISDKVQGAKIKIFRVMGQRVHQSLSISGIVALYTVYITFNLSVKQSINNKWHKEITELARKSKNILTIMVSNAFSLPQIKSNQIMINA